MVFMTKEQLTTEASLLGISKERAEAVAVLLYENGYISYPYSSGKTLPVFCKETVGVTLDAINLAIPGAASGLSANLSSAIFVEPFLEAHHTIIPSHDLTQWKGDLSEVAPEASQIFKIIADAYVSAVAA